MNYELYSKIMTYHYKSKPNYNESVKYIHNLLSEKYQHNVESELLDFGAGFGIQAIEFAKLGYFVSAVESSIHMINVFKTNLNNCDKDVKSRIKLYYDDYFSIISTLSKHKKYNLIYSLGNTVSALGNLDSIKSFFAMAKSMLDKDGHIAFDVLYFKKTNNDGNVKWSDSFVSPITKETGRTCCTKKCNIDNCKNKVDVTIYAKWLKERDERCESETYNLFLIDSVILKEICDELNFEIEFGIDQSNWKTSDENSNSVLWIIKNK